METFIRSFKSPLDDMPVIAQDNIRILKQNTSTNSNIHEKL